MISIIVPVYNSEKYLRKCIESIISQSYSNYEVILVNDGSTDSSLNICKQYSLQDDRFKVYTKPNGGASSARNYGLTKVTGDWICFIDSDDWVKNDYLKKMHDSIVPNACVMLSKDLESVTIPEKNISDYIIQNFVQLNTVNKLYDYQIIKQYNIKFPQGFVNGEDFIFACTYFKYTKSLIITKADEYIYNRNENSISNKKNSYEEERRDYLAMRLSWEELLKKNQILNESITEKTWRSPVRTRFEHLLYSIITGECSYKHKLLLMNQMKIDITNYAKFYPGKVKRKIIAMFLLRNGYFKTYLLLNKYLLKHGKHLI